MGDIHTLRLQSAAEILECHPDAESVANAFAMLFPQIELGEKKASDLTNEIIDGKCWLEVVDGEITRIRSLVHLRVSHPVQPLELVEQGTKRFLGTLIEVYPEESLQRAVERFGSQIGVKLSDLEPDISYDKPRTSSHGYFEYLGIKSSIYYNALTCTMSRRMVQESYVKTSGEVFTWGEQ